MLSWYMIGIRIDIIINVMDAIICNAFIMSLFVCLNSIFPQKHYCIVIIKQLYSSYVYNKNFYNFILIIIITHTHDAAVIITR